jgi:adenosylcobinamide-GDP ribazoletransferase
MGQTLALAAIVSGLVGVVAVGWLVVPVGIAIFVVTGVWALIAKAKIGGQTGDILGAAQQIAEIAALACLASALAG